MLLFLAALSGCTPTCEEVCDHLVTCKGMVPAGATSAECEEACVAQRDLYDKWTDTSLQGGFDEQLTCLAESTCEAISLGRCYDAHIWSYGESQP
jgi:hypothetical protein